jgi:hypothetical protein
MLTLQTDYEEGAAGTNKDRKSDPLKEFSDKEPIRQKWSYNRHFVLF